MNTKHMKVCFAAVLLALTLGPAATSSLRAQGSPAFEAEAARANGPARTDFGARVATPNPVKQGQAIEFKARLLYFDRGQKDWRPLPNKPVEFSFMGSIIGSDKTDAKGWAKMPWTVPSNLLGSRSGATVTWHVQFDRRANYLGTRASDRLTVTK
jgi:hypothetical protein